MHQTKENGMNRMMSRIACGALGAACVTAALAQNIETIFASTGPLSAVPGEALTFESFDRPVRSPDGSYWMLLTRNTGASSTDAMYITGQGTTGTVQVLEGFTTIVDERFPDSMSDRECSINDAGQWVATFSISEDTGSDEVLVTGDQMGNISIVGQEGQAIADPVGASYGSFNYSARINNAGQYAFGWDLNGPGIDSSNDVTFYIDGNIVARDGSGGFADFVNTTFYVSDDFMNWSIEGDVAGAASDNEDVFIVNGISEVREGEPIPGLPGTVERLTGGTTESNGDWYVRVRMNDLPNEDGTGAVLRNGAILVKSGDPVPGGEPGETWDTDVWQSSFNTTFFKATGNNNGDYVVGGFTSNADPDRNAVWVLNGSEVIVRNGDQVDINNDGTLDDDAYIYFSSLTTASPKPLGGFLTDDGWFYFTADIRNAIGDDLGEAFLRVRAVSPPCLGDITGDGSVDSGDLNILLTNWGCPNPADFCQGADLEGNLTVDSADLNILLSAFGPCP